MGGRFPLDWVAGFRWTGWPNSLEYALSEEKPDMGAVAGARSFYRVGDTLGFAGIGKCPDVGLPLTLVEIHGKKPTGLVWKHGR
jgi:hypothetical protein